MTAPPPPGRPDLDTRALSLLLLNGAPPSAAWLAATDNMPDAATLQGLLVEPLQEALSRETDPSTVQAYLRFLATHAKNALQLASSLGHLLSSRRFLARCLLADCFDLVFQILISGLPLTGQPPPSLKPVLDGMLATLSVAKETWPLPKSLVKFLFSSTAPTYADGSPLVGQEQVVALAQSENKAVAQHSLALLRAAPTVLLKLLFRFGLPLDSYEQILRLLAPLQSTVEIPLATSGKSQVQLQQQLQLLARLGVSIGPWADLVAGSTQLLHPQLPARSLWLRKPGANLSPYFQEPTDFSNFDALCQQEPATLTKSVRGALKDPKLRPLLEAAPLKLLLVLRQVDLSAIPPSTLNTLYDSVPEKTQLQSLVVDLVQGRRRRPSCPTQASHPRFCQVDLGPALELVIGNGPSASILNQLLHYGDWASVIDTATALSKSRSSAPTLVLEYLSALSQHPRLWAGYLRRSRPVLDLALLTPLLAAEAAHGPVPASRLHLLRPAGCSLAHAEQAFRLIAESEMPAGPKEELLGGIAASFPSLLLAQPGLSAPCGALAKTLHRIVQRLADPTLAVASSEVFCRIARTYPGPALQFVPVLASLLEGRAIDLTQVLARQDYVIFERILPILDALRPQVFACDSLPDILTQCLRLVTLSPSPQSELLSFIVDLIQFVQFYATTGAGRAFLRKHRRSLQALAGLPSVDTLLAVLDRHSSHSQLLSPVVPELAPEVLVELHTALDHGQAKDAVASLLRLDEVSRVNPAVLEPFLDKLLLLVQNPHKMLSATAHTLLLRYIRLNPAAADSIVEVYLRCFSHPDPVVRQTALLPAPQYAVHLRAATPLLLRVLFRMGEQAVPQLRKIWDFILQLR